MSLKTAPIVIWRFGLFKVKLYWERNQEVPQEPGANLYEPEADSYGTKSYNYQESAGDIVLWSKELISSGNRKYISQEPGSIILRSQLI